MYALSRRTFLGAAGLAGVAGSGLMSALAATPAWARAAEASFAFAHPGLLHSRADLARMKSAVAAGHDPIATGFAALAADPRSQHTWTVRNTGQITRWGRGPTSWTGEAAGDAAAAYHNALMWAVTGDVRHADKARDILDAWAASLTGITGADGQLGAGIQGFKLVNAAEILRHTAFGHLLTATHHPTRFTARGLPDGLRLDPRTGLVSGTPTGTGEFTVTTTAANATGTATSTLTLDVRTPPPDPWSYGDLGDVVLDERALGAYGAAYVATPGSTAHEDGTFVVRGAGIDLSVNNQNGTVRLPCLLRLKRAGTAFTASVSTDDGATWTALASGEIPDFGDAPYYVGLVVCSRDPLARRTTEFDEVSITGT